MNDYGIIRENSLYRYCTEQEEMIRFAAYTYVKDEALAEEITDRVFERAAGTVLQGKTARETVAGIVREESVRVMEEVILKTVKSPPGQQTVLRS